MRFENFVIQSYDYKKNAIQLAEVNVHNPDN